MPNHTIDDVMQLLRSLVSKLDGNQGPADKQFFTVNEAAAIVKRRPFTVREWCRLSRLQSQKDAEGNYRISADELRHYQNHGLRPNPLKYRHVT